MKALAFTPQPIEYRLEAHQFVGMMGTMLVKAISARDLPLIEGGVMYVALCCVAAYLLTDILYALIDPRVRLGEGAGG